MYGSGRIVLFGAVEVSGRRYSTDTASTVRFFLIMRIAYERAQVPTQYGTAGWVFLYLRGSGPCVDGTRPSVGRRAGPSVGVPANRSRAPGHTAGTTNTINQAGE